MSDHQARDPQQQPFSRDLRPIESCAPPVEAHMVEHGAGEPRASLRGHQADGCKHALRGVPCESPSPGASMSTRALSGCDFELASPAKLDSLNVWASTFGPKNLRWLRKLSLRMPPRAVHPAAARLGLKLSWSETKLRFQYSPDTGVSVDEHPCLTPASNKMLQEHVKAVRESAKSLGLGGGILVLVLTANPSIWGKLETI